jgi:hypothetical protein
VVVEQGTPVEELVKSCWRGGFVKRPMGVRTLRDALKEDTGSNISSTLRLWNWIKVGISRADSGESYLCPCLIVRDLRSPRAIMVVRKQDEKWIDQFNVTMNAPRAPSNLERAP